jgi:hypothetical protein
MEEGNFSDFPDGKRRIRPRRREIGLGKLTDEQGALRPAKHYSGGSRIKQRYNHMKALR